MKALGVASVSFSVFILYGVPWTAYREIRASHIELSAMNADVQHQIDSISQDILSMKNPKYLERVIRDELNYIKKNEITMEISLVGDK